MRKSSKYLSLAAIGTAMSLSMAMPVFAGEVTLPENDGVSAGHKYDVYQILTGTYSEGENGEKALNTALWGAHSTGTEGTRVSDTDLAALEGCTSADDIAGYANVTGAPAALDVDGETITMDDVAAGTTLNLPDGYYLIVDDTEVEGEDTALSTYMIKVSGGTPITITPKATKPTFDKQVWDEAADGETANESWGESADHEINEIFQFRLVATLPESTEFDSYDSYTVKFWDDLSDSVTYDGNMKVTVVDANGKTTELTAEQYSNTAVAGTAGAEFTVQIDDLKKIVSDISGAVVTVQYDAHLNANAKVGAGNMTFDGNANKANLQYSNNPGNTGEGGSLGKTPDDTVFVFTYSVTASKTDEKGQSLANAEFKLTDANGATINLTKNADGAYYPDVNGSATFKTVKDEEIKIIGLDHGTYHLEEVTAPSGYNLLKSPVEIVLSASHKEDTTEDKATATLTTTATVEGTKTENATTITIQNKKGPNLPETGGMGTTIIYTVGSMLVVGAGAALLRRRRVED